MNTHPSILALALALVTLVGCQSAPPPVAEITPAREYVQFALRACDVVEANLKETIRVAELVAQRHLHGGLIGFPYNYQAVQQELMGRSGGMVCTGFERGWKKERTQAEMTNDMAIISWERPPAPHELKSITNAKKRGCLLIGFGPRRMPALAEHAAVCDVWFDTGFGEQDLVVQFDDGTMAGRGNALMTTLHGWVFTAEIVSALTRHGKMPTMWKSYSMADGREWGDQYLGKKQFHDDFQVAPIGRGVLAREYLNQIRALLRKFEETQLDEVEKSARLVVKEARAGKKVVVASMGHMPWTFVGKYEDAKWSEPFDLHHTTPDQVKTYLDKSREGALVLRLGYSGQHEKETAIFEKKQQREMLITAVDNPRPEWQIPTNLVSVIDMGWSFGDACVEIKNYPIKILPPSGVMQIVAYECVNVEVLERLGEKN